MNIVYVANEAFAPYLGASLASLYERNKRVKNIRVFLISTGMSEGSLDQLEKMAQGYGRSLEVLYFNRLRERVGFSVDTGRFDISIMGRLFVGELLPREIKRVLYLDCDTVVLHSLDRLYQKDLKGKVLGAVPEPTIPVRVRYEIRLDPEAVYYNSGVLLIDLEKWRRDGIGERILAYYKSISPAALFGDQDAMNGALRWDIQPLAPKYNFFSNYKYFSYGALKKSGLYPCSKQAFLQAKRHPVIVHFAGDERPWNRGSWNPYRRAYFFFKAKTPFAREPLVKGKELYMGVYHLLNLLTAVCPWIRGEVARGRIHRAMEKRMAAQKEGA